MTPGQDAEEKTGRPGGDAVARSPAGGALARAVGWLYLAPPAALAIATRALAFSKMSGGPLEGDAAAFYRLASQTVTPWSASPREPFFMLLHRAAYLASGGAAWSIRLQSAVFSVVLAALIAAACFRSVGNKTAAALGGTLFALTPYMAYNSARGLRLELYMSLVFGLALLLMPAEGKVSWKRALVAGLFAAAIELTRQVGAAMVVAVLLAFLLRNARDDIKDALKKAGLVVAVTIALAAPFYICQWRTYGDAFHIGVKDATFWRNQEFRDLPGHHNSAELEKDPYAGPPVTPFQYMFGSRPLSETLSRIGLGYVRAFTFFYRHALGFAWPLLFLALPGAYYLVRKGRLEWPFILAAGILPFAFILTLDVAGHGSVDARFAMHGYPALCVIMAAGVAWAIEAASSFLRPAPGEGGEH